MATELEKIISVSGKSGLFKVVSAGKVAVVAESLVDGKRQPILSTQRVSTLADISMFTYEEDVPLKQVLLNMKNVYGEVEGFNMEGALAVSLVLLTCSLLSMIAASKWAERQG